MGAFRRAREGGKPAVAATGRGMTVGRAVGRAVRICWRVAVSLTVILSGTALLLYLMLLRGPVRIPGAADWVAEAAAPDLGGKTLEIGDVMLSLGEAGTPSGVQFVDVRLASEDGVTLIDVPRLGVVFDAADLFAGHLQPRRIVLSGPSARLIRDAAGHFRFGFGAIGGISLESGSEEPAGDDPAATAVALIDGFAGGEALPEALARLEEIRIQEAQLVYTDRIAERSWTSGDATLVLRRVAGGAELLLDATVTDSAEDGFDTPPTKVVLEGTRRTGVDESRIALFLTDARPTALAAEFPSLEWLSLIEAPLEGDLEVVLGDDGALRGLGARIAVSGGRVPGPGEEVLILERMVTYFELEPETERIRVTAAEIVSEPVTARVSGFFDLERSPNGDLEGLVGQVDVTSLNLDLPDIFDTELAFDAGRITARMDLDPMRFQIGEARLERESLVLEALGEARAGRDGWLTDLRVAARNVTVQDLISHWPVFAARNARTWIADRISEGTIHEMIAQVRLGRDVPDFTLDFTFSDLTGHYVETMSPLTEATGRGHLDIVQAVLAVDSAVITPPGAEPVRVGGSKFVIRDVEADVTIGDVYLVAEAPVSSMLALIDQPPLHLVRKLGADLGSPSGLARVEAEMSFPLLKDLPLEDVGADVSAVFTNLSLSPELAGARVPVAGDRVTLTADTAGMRLSGKVTADGVPLDVTWSERFSGSGGRDLTLGGTITPKLLAGLLPGVEVPMREGRAPATLKLSQQGAGAFDFTLQADLGPARMVLPELSWAKPAGTAGRLNAKGRLGDRLEITAFQVKAADLEAEGAVSLTPSSALDRLTLSRLVLGERADLSIELWKDASGALRANASGRKLDLTEFLAEGEGDVASGTPIRAELSLDRLYLSENVVLTAATGEYLRTAGGAAQARLEGLVGGSAPAVLAYRGGAGQDDRIRVTSEDAGAFLAGSGYFDGGTGGTMRLRALIAPTDAVDAQGVLVIEDMRVRQAPTLSDILTRGDAPDLSGEVAGGGLRFSRIEVPFVYGGGVVELTDAIATSPSLAIKVQGIYEESRDVVDMTGVISPAYAVTGVLDQIPLLGTILSGGEGEGIFAMTFSARGPVESPDVDVQPLSLLTPGILRTIFSGSLGDGALPEREFLERIERPDQ